MEELQMYATSEGAEMEWVQKFYEYNLSEETQTQCNKQTAEVVLKII